ncbi:MAG: response regulator transcription factor [Chitinophagaceae bacterium]|nr:response regulator transcription factor [Chitinophagaceae bacterium]
MIHISIVEDDSKYAQTLKKMIESEPDIVVQEMFSNAAEAKEKLPETGSHVILMDIQLPDGKGTDLVHHLKDKIPHVHFIMNTSFDDDENIFYALQGGASGYIIKTDSTDKIVESIRDVLNGGAPMSSGVAKKVIQYFNQSKQQKKELEDLTPKENQILEMLAKGLYYKEISRDLAISLDTVKKHCGNMYRKLHVNNKTEAINIYLGRK